MEADNVETDVKVPWFHFGYKGPGVGFLMVMLIAILGAALIAGLYYHDAAAQNRSTAGHEEVLKNTKAVEALTKSVDEQKKMTKVIVYVLSLPQTERDKLKLREPEELREMQR